VRAPTTQPEYAISRRTTTYSSQTEAPPTARHSRCCADSSPYAGGRWPTDPQGGTTCHAPSGVERLGHLGRVDRLGDCQAEDRNDRWIGYLAKELRSEGSQYVRERLAIVRHGQVGGHQQSRGGALMHAISISFLLPASAYSSRFVTRAHMAISRRCYSHYRIFIFGEA
jgi:hypothetical protein